MTRRVSRTIIGYGANSAVITDIAAIQAGDLFLVADGTIITTAAAAAALSSRANVKIAMGIGNGVVRYSSPISGRDVTAFTGAKYSAPVQEVQILGYNGTAGTGITVQAEQPYRLRTRIIDNWRLHGQKPTIIDYNYTASTSDTAEIVAYNILQNSVQEEYGRNFNKSLIKLERVSDGTRTALANIPVVVKDSKTVTITAHGLTAGTKLRLDTVAVNSKSPVYTISEVVDVNTVKLDIPYQGESGTIALANSGSLATVTEWGFKVTALAQDSNVYHASNDPLDEYEWVQFESVFTDVQSESVTNYEATKTVVSNAFPGTNYWKQIAMEERLTKKLNGDNSYMRYFDKQQASVVDPTKTYNSIVINGYNTYGSDHGDSRTTELGINIYMPVSSDQSSTASNNFAAILNSYFSTVLKFSAVSFA